MMHSYDLGNTIAMDGTHVWSDMVSSITLDKAGT